MSLNPDRLSLVMNATPTSLYTVTLIKVAKFSSKPEAEPFTPILEDTIIILGHLVRLHSEHTIYRKLLRDPDLISHDKPKEKISLLFDAITSAQRIETLEAKLHKIFFDNTDLQRVILHSDGITDEEAAACEAEINAAIDLSRTPSENPQ